LWRLSATRDITNGCRNGDFILLVARAEKKAAKKFVNQIEEHCKNRRSAKKCQKNVNNGKKHWQKMVK
jgi:hypothetical protein